jgi:long-chain acyl-CoA synthetase
MSEGGLLMLLSAILPTVTRMHPANIAIKTEFSSWTYEQLLEQTSCVAAGFRKLGIKPGDRIALLGHPSPQLIIAECAALAVGAIPLSIFPQLTLSEIKPILLNAEPVALVYDDKDTPPELLMSLTRELSAAAELLISCTAGHAGPSLEKLIEDCPPLHYTDWHQADPDDPALLIYTGGTTGRSKGVIHSHRSIRHWSFMDPNKGGGHHPAKKALLPNLSHLTGQFILWTTLFEGGCLLLASGYPLQATEVVQLIEREQIKFLGTVGLLFRDILQLDDIASRNVSSVQGISCGGAPISEDTLRRARTIFPNAQITEVYAQTESGQFISYLSVNECMRDDKPNRLRSVGNPSHIINWGQQPFAIRIVNDEGNDVASGEAGEVICQSPQIMLGYWNNEEETSKALRDGWLYTGDVGKLDEDGFLYLLDRKKDIVIVGASNVYCAEVEAVLGAHPSVQEVAIIGTPLPVEGEAVTALIVLQQGSTLTLEEASQYCRRKLAAFKVPTRLEIVAALPRTPAGKLNKAAMRELYRRS